VFGIGNVGPGAVASIVSGKGAQQALQIQSVTSTLDGIIKWPMIVSQAAIVGGIFSDLFLWVHLLDYDLCTSNDIKQHTKKGGSTISWHLSWLRKAGIISARSGMHQTYRLRNKDLVAILMNKSQKSGISC
jgi:DNA-binding transcriptional ArsR family regulator